MRLFALFAAIPFPPPTGAPTRSPTLKLDRTSIPYDGKTPDKMVCDTTLRELPDGSWALFMLAGDDFEPSPRNYTGTTLSFDGLKTWPYRRVLVPESCDGPKGRLNYPDGFVSKDRQWLHFAFDDHRDRAVHYSAKLPALPAAK